MDSIPWKTTFQRYAKPSKRSARWRESRLHNMCLTHTLVSLIQYLMTLCSCCVHFDHTFLAYTSTWHLYPHDRKGGGLVVQLPSNMACRPQSSVVRITDFPPSHVTLAVFSMTRYMTLLLDFFKAWEPILRPVVSDNTACWQYAQVHSL